MSNFLFVKTNGSYGFAPNEGLESLQSAVDGWIEGIPLGNGAFMYCNEEGKLKGLPANLIATTLFQAHYGKTDIICGDVAIVGDVSPSGDSDGADYDPPSWVVDRVKEEAKAFAPRCEVRPA